ncbi:MAG: L-threonylcarbamoyladenylate synthase [Bacteroidales bacterium]|jgi:L-threonylcarbamoyladenylate synthase|nr:L-threonylcarbamoyladenylate synthase [Bacteroidales bacterium]
MNADEDIKQSLDVLRRGGVILYPTDTIWGIGCDATNSSAVERIYEIKSRSTTKSLIILVDGEAMLERYVTQVPEVAWELLSVSDSPLTIVYPGGRNLAAGICSGDGYVGIRICREQFCNSLIGRLRKPLVSTSANFSGTPSPAFYDEIDPGLAAMMDYVVKYRQDDRREFSSSPVIRLEIDGSVKILRK